MTLLISVLKERLKQRRPWEIWTRVISRVCPACGYKQQIKARRIAHTVVEKTYLNCKLCGCVLSLSYIPDANLWTLSTVSKAEINDYIVKNWRTIGPDMICRSPSVIVE